jgi:hypothetical protein
MSEQVAVVTDIHSNLPALEASLARIEGPGIERACCEATSSAAAPTRTRSVDASKACDPDDAVRKPKDGDPSSSFAVPSSVEGDVSVSIERVEYDALGVAREIRAVGLPGELADTLVAAA